MATVAPHLVLDAGEQLDAGDHRVGVVHLELDQGDRTGSIARTSVRSAMPAIAAADHYPGRPLAPLPYRGLWLDRGNLAGRRDRPELGSNGNGRSRLAPGMVLDLVKTSPSRAPFSRGMAPDMVQKWCKTPPSIWSRHFPAPRRRSSRSPSRTSLRSAARSPSAFGTRSNWSFFRRFGQVRVLGRCTSSNRTRVVRPGAAHAGDRPTC